MAAAELAVADTAGDCAFISDESGDICGAVKGVLLTDVAEGADTPDCVVELDGANALLPAIRDDAPGATHFVQIVDVEVLSIVEITVVTCCVGLPPAGVMVLVTGQVVIVV